MEPVSLTIIMTTIGWLARPIFKKAVDVAYEHYTKRVGLQKEIEDLIEELKSFKVPKETEETTPYLQEVKELVCQARDLLDELDYFRLQEEVKQMNKDKQGNILSKLKLPSRNDHVPSSSMKGAFKELKFDKKVMSSRMKDFIKKLNRSCPKLNSEIGHVLLGKIAESVEKVNKPNRRQTDSFFSEDKFYGRVYELGQIKKLINHVEQHPHELSVLAIVGHGGIGKTTLAQEVYNKLTPSFEPKMWICVSTNLDEMGIIRQMLKCCSPDNESYGIDHGNNLLKKKLVECLKDKKFLLVLDDIWDMSEDEWKSLLAPLKSHATTNNTGSMVLVTTRDPSIARMVSTTEPICLDRMHSGDLTLLFKKCAFGDDRYNVPPPLKTICERIIEKLSGNPLIAKTVGSLLQDKTDPRKWEEIYNSEELMSMKDIKDKIIPILKLSYDYLSTDLRHCFSYCSLFPKGHYFKKKELIYMWMAQDFIHTDDERVEDVGIGYLKELVERAFFQIIVKEKVDKVYVVHDFMYDLAQAVSSKELLVKKNPQLIPNQPSLFRHISFLPDVDCTIENHVQFPNLASLVILQNETVLKDNLNCDEANRVRIRLLILPYLRSISYNFSHFIHLRYLRLNNNGLGLFRANEKAKFPVQICKLYHLEVLELRDNSWNSFMELPRDFNNLVNLRHFIANKTLHSKIAGVGRLKHLQELQKFVVLGEKGFELSELSELELTGSLQICNLHNVETTKEADGIQLSKKKIKKLELDWDPSIWNKKGQERRTTCASPEEILEALEPNSELRDLSINYYGGSELHSWIIDSTKYLKSIHLSGCLELIRLPDFSQLESLEQLYLSTLYSVNAFGPEFHGCGNNSQGGFPSLKVLEVTYMKKLETWTWNQESKVFPVLERLIVRNCPNLKKLSFVDLLSVQAESSKLFPKLVHLSIEDCPQLPEGIGPLLLYRYTHNIAANDIRFSYQDIEYAMSYKWLRIKNAKYLETIEFVNNFKDICSMQVTNCPIITSLSWKCICMLHSLCMLTFGQCDELRFSPDDEEEKDDGRTFYSHKSLEGLTIQKCRVSGKELSYLLAHLPALSRLSMMECHGIGSVLLPSVKDKLKLNSGSLEAGAMVNRKQPRSPGSPLYDYLHIDGCPDMVFINEGGLSGQSTVFNFVLLFESDKLLSSMTQKEGTFDVCSLSLARSQVTSLRLSSFVALRSLRLHAFKRLTEVEGPKSLDFPKVDITDCPQLTRTPSENGPKFLMPVEKLGIDNIEFLSIHANNFSMSLHSLTITGEHVRHDSEKWTEWTEEQENVLIKQLTALKELTLYSWPDLRSLPSTFSNHPSIEELTIDKCPEIKSLPQSGFPKSLRKLFLRDISEELRSQCSQLEDFECSVKIVRKWETHREYHEFCRRSSNQLASSTHR